MVAPSAKDLPGVQETLVGSVGGDDPQEKEMSAHSAILHWKIPWREEPDGRQPMG